MQRFTVEGVVQGRHVRASNHEADASVVYSDQEFINFLAVILEQVVES